MAFDPLFHEEKRKGDDIWLIIIRCLCVCGWVLLVLALFLLGYAKPQVETFFDRYYELQLVSRWDMTLASYIFYMLITGQVFSIVGLIINFKRRRRKGDEIRYSLVLMALSCAIGIGLYFYTFR